MPVLKNIRYCTAGLLLSCCILTAQADIDVSIVKQASLSLENNDYNLSADVNYHFSKKAMAALQSGVPLFWELVIKLQQQRDVLWDKTLVEKHLRFRIQYHALFNIYRIKNETTDEVSNFATLQAALDYISIINGLPIINSKLMDLKNQSYQLAVRVLFRRNKLPTPLRPLAYLDEQWSLSSDWYVLSVTP